MSVADLSHARAQALSLFLRKPKWYVYEICPHLEQSSEAVSRMLRMMESDGLLAGEKEMTGKKRVIYQLTPLGERAAPAAAAWLEALEAA